MKNLQKAPALPWLTLGLGVTALLAALMLCTAGVDAKGLFIAWHWSGIFLGIVTALMVASLAVVIRPLDGKAKHRQMFPASKAGALGRVVMAVAILSTALDSLTAVQEPVRILSGILKILAAGALGYLALCRWYGRRGSFLAWTAVTAYLMLRLMFEYRSWSAQPELLRYCFHLLSSVCFTLAFYQRAAFSVNLGSRRQFLLFSQLGAFFAMPTLVIGFHPFYLGAAVWAVTDLCSLQPFPHLEDT